MAWGLPSGRRRPRDYSGAAARRLKAGPAKGAGPALADNPANLSPGKATPGGRPVATAPGPATHRQQPSSSPAPAAVLGASHAAPGDTVVAGVTRVNQNAGGAASIGYGADRVGKRFTVGFTPDGRVVHLYGNDVPADQRRVVLRKGQRA